MSSQKRIRARVLGVDEYYEWIFDNSVPGLPEKAAAENLTPLEFMRRYGAFEVKQKVGAIYEEPVGAEELEDIREDALAACSRARRSLLRQISFRFPVPTAMKMAGDWSA